MEQYSRQSFDPTRPNELALFDVDGTLRRNTPEEFTGDVFWKMVEMGEITDDMITPQPVYVESDEAAAYGGTAFRIASIGELRDLKEEFNHLEGFARRSYLNPLVATFDKAIRGKPQATLDRIGTAIVQETTDSLYPEVLEEFKWWRDEHKTFVGLISGSPDFVVQALKRHLGADIATGTRYHFSGGKYHPYRPAESRGHNKGPIAESMLIDMTRRRLGRVGLGALPPGTHRPKLTDFDPKDRFSVVAAYGDTPNDLGILKMAKIPVAVNPTTDLRIIASNQRWHIIDTKSAT